MHGDVHEGMRYVACINSCINEEKIFRNFEIRLGYLNVRLSGYYVFRLLGFSLRI